MAHEEYKEMLPALALSALDSGEARALNQHLSECSDCRRDLADWESTAAALALTVDPVEPSAEVREWIMSAVRSDKPQQESRVVQFPSSRRNIWMSFGRLGAVAATVLFGALILWSLVLWQQNRELQRSRDSLRNQIQSLQEEIDRSEEFVQLLSSPGAKVALLRGTDEVPEATASLAYDRTGRAMLMVTGLPPTNEGFEYQLWFIVGKNPPVPGKTFVPDYMWRATLEEQVPQQVLDSAVFAITLEPEGGVPAPTGEIYLRSGQ